MAEIAGGCFERASPGCLEDSLSLRLRCVKEGNGQAVILTREWTGVVSVAECY